MIKLTSRGPVLYKSKRAGEGFKVFDFYKFRTMVAGAEEILDSLHIKNMYDSSQGNPCFFKVSNDPRVTRIGLFLRNTSFDELPQLFNVLKGDMSLVGNRPLPLYEATTLTTREWAERFMAPAGITGLWQISKKGKTKNECRRKNIPGYNLCPEQIYKEGSENLTRHSIGFITKTKSVIYS